jgi:hypothetical protein
MNKNPTPDELQAALTRLIEGEAEPHDDALVAEMLRAHPELRAQLRQQLQLDALLRLEAEPTAQAFVESVAARTQPPADDEAAFLRRVTGALPTSSSEAVNQRPFRGSWLSWRPLTAAAAGIVLGMFCTSMVFAYVAPPLGKVIALLQESFESGPAPLVTGVPIEAGKWSGDYTEVVGEQQGAMPANGKKILRFLRADFDGKVKPEGSYISDVYQLIDLRPYQRKFADGGAVVQLSAAFNAFAFPAEEAFGCSVSLHALDAETAMNGSTRIGETLLTDCLAMARNSRTKLDRNPATWQRLSAELRLPPNTDFLLIRISVDHSTKSQRRATFDGHYLDDVRLTLARRAPLP